MNRALLPLALWAPLCAAAPPVSFTPTKPRLAPAAQEYRALWWNEGPRIVAALEARTGFAFPDATIEVLVTSGGSMTAFDGRTMRLRASYPADVKRAVLVHELGHRLAFTMERPVELDDHRLLFLFLYDVWADLYGEDFAARMVALERGSASQYDYDAAWTWALSMSRAERQKQLRALRPIDSAGPR